MEKKIQEKINKPNMFKYADPEKRSILNTSTWYASWKLYQHWKHKSKKGKKKEKHTSQGGAPTKYLLNYSIPNFPFSKYKQASANDVNFVAMKHDVKVTMIILGEC